ncbi:MAG: ribonucleoside-triphosphate reductase, adenosylcobalamin-dependent, partial [Halanaerobiales bacterium]|nr:ribonucleoside-triphosphate reductase, adenosylcobalamin-dependent [Halanaerobiales bacterium]
MLEIIKRDGTTQQFKKSKIVNAIHGAYDDTDIEFDLQLATQIAEEIKDEVQLAFDSFGNVLSIENVQDLVETRLMKEGEPEVAKKYILYRNKHKEIREHWRPYKSFKYLSNDFLRQYADKEDPFGTQLSKFTFYRTYSRFIKEVGRRETWLEMNARIVDYIIDLDPQGHKELAEELFDYLYNFKMFTSGRIRYTGGTKAIKKHFQSAFNCSFMIIDTVEKFSELCHLLMLGSGMGFRIFKEDVEQVEPVRQDIELIHKSYEPKEPQKRQELTTTNLTDNILEIVVGDSKAGWSNAIGTLFDYLTNKRMSSNSKFVKTILINYDNVRPEGELLKTFLGRASGPQPLKKVMKNINRIVKESDGRKMSRNRVKLKSIDILDIAGLIAEAIVV